MKQRNKNHEDHDLYLINMKNEFSKKDYKNDQYDFKEKKIRPISYSIKNFIIIE